MSKLPIAKYVKTINEVIRFRIPGMIENVGHLPFKLVSEICECCGQVIRKQLTKMDLLNYALDYDPSMVEDLLYLMWLEQELKKEQERERNFAWEALKGYGFQHSPEFYEDRIFAWRGMI